MINIHLLKYQLSQASLPVECVDINGRIDYSRTLTPAEQAHAAQVIAAHDPNGLLPEEQNERNYQSIRQAYLNFLDDGIVTYPTMTNAQKQAYVIAHFDELMKGIRALIKKTT